MKINAALAQSVEQGTENPCVRSSILRGGTIFHAVVTQLVECWTENPVVGGSNPPGGTKRKQNE